MQPDPFTALGFQPQGATTAPQQGQDPFAALGFQVAGKTSGTLGTNPNDSLYGKVIDNSITRGIQNFFPGKQLGTAAGNSISGLSGLFSGNQQQFQDAATDNSKMVGRVAGDVANIGLTVAGPLLGGAPTVLGRIGSNVLLGAGIGGSNAIAQGSDLKTAGKDALIGGLAGGVISGGTEGLSALLSKIPNRIVQTILPKLNEKNAAYALENTKLGTTNSLIKDAVAQSYKTQNQIKSILAKPQYSQVAENGQNLLQDAVQSFGNSEYSPTDLIKAAKKLTPENASLLSRIEANQANLGEINKVRSALDGVTSKRFGDTPKLTSQKEIGAKLADVFRKHVQEAAPETADLFAQNSIEINFARALAFAQKAGKSNSTFNIYSIINHLGAPAAGIAGAVTGFKSGDTPGGKLRNAVIGGIGGFGGTKLATSPAARLLVVKALQGLGKGSVDLLQGVKAPVQNAIQSKPTESDYLNQLGY